MNTNFWTNKKVLTISGAMKTYMREDFPSPSLLTKKHYQHILQIEGIIKKINVSKRELIFKFKRSGDRIIVWILINLLSRKFKQERETLPTKQFHLFYKIKDYSLVRVFFAIIITRPSPTPNYFQCGLQERAIFSHILILFHISFQKSSVEIIELVEHFVENK